MIKSHLYPLTEVVHLTTWLTIKCSLSPKYHEYGKWKSLISHSSCSPFSFVKIASVVFSSRNVCCWSFGSWGTAYKMSSILFPERRTGSHEVKHPQFLALHYSSETTTVWGDPYLFHCLTNVLLFEILHSCMFISDVNLFEIFIGLLLKSKGHFKVIYNHSFQTKPTQSVTDLLGVELHYLRF